MFEVPKHHLIFREGKPYLTRTENDTFEGYAYDLIEAIAKQMNFTFEFIRYNETGVYDKETKRWNGLIGDLVERVSRCVVLQDLRLH